MRNLVATLGTVTIATAVLVEFDLVPLGTSLIVLAVFVAAMNVVSVLVRVRNKGAGSRHDASQLSAAADGAPRRG